MGVFFGGRCVGGGGGGGGGGGNVHVYAQHSHSRYKCSLFFAEFMD